MRIIKNFLKINIFKFRRVNFLFFFVVDVVSDLFFVSFLNFAVHLIHNEATRLINLSIDNVPFGIVNCIIDLFSLANNKGLGIID